MDLTDADLLVRNHLSLRNSGRDRQHPSKDNVQRVLEAAKTGGGGAEIVPANVMASIEMPRSASLTVRDSQEFVMNNLITLYDSAELMRRELSGYGIELSNVEPSSSC